MILRLAFAAFACFLLTPASSAQAQFQSIKDHDWCFENMPGVYDKVFDACVDDKCIRISNKKISQKRACYRRCSRDAVDACLAKRDAGGMSQAARPVAPVRPALRQPTAPGAPQPSAQPADPALSPAVAARPADAVPAASAEAQREGFMSRLFGGWGSGPETRSEPAVAAPADGAAPVAPDDQGEGKRKGFFTRLMDGATTGVSEGFDPDYNWCRDHSGGYFQEVLQDCTRDCLAGPSSAANRRRGCIQSCKSDAVDACIARRDGK